MSYEIGRNDPLTITDKACIGIFMLWFMAVLLLVITGCSSFYENAGLHVRTGSLVAPIEVSDKTDTITVRGLYSHDGIDLYVAKQCCVNMRYSNLYTNSYLGLVTTRGTQSSEVTVQPCMDEPLVSTE